MSDYLIVDAHIHTYPSKEIAVQAWGALPHPPTGHFGTIEDTLAIMKEEGIAKAIMMNLLPSYAMREAHLSQLPQNLSSEQLEAARKEVDQALLSRVQRRSLWTCSVAKENPSLIPFMTVDPMMDDKLMREEIRDKVQNHGAKGIKLHPAEGRYFPNDHRLWPAYQTAQELDLPIMSHSGRFALVETQFAEPRYFEEVLSSFPKLRLVLAHLGCNYWDQTRSLARSYPNLNFDCCAMLDPESEYPVSDAELVALIRDVGVERVMYGSDFPFIDTTRQLHRVLGLNLTEKEKRLILGENALRIYKLG